MRKRIAAVMLFTDDCAGWPDDRKHVKMKMKAFNETGADEFE